MEEKRLEYKAILGSIAKVPKPTLPKAKERCQVIQDEVRASKLVTVQWSV